MFLHFVLAFISGMLSRRRTIQFDTRTGFLAVLSAWLFIISIDEVFQHFSPRRAGQIGDILYNMEGAILGVLLSIKWFRGNRPVLF